jgi:mannitol-1-/sugar-/sorbitol-6-phosphatase
VVELLCSGVLFDLDGVLADSTTAVERHWRTFALRRGLVPGDVVRVAHGRRSIDVISALVPQRELDLEASWFERLEVDDTADVVVLPGARELADALSSDRWGIVTSCGGELAEARLHAAGLPIPDILINGDQVDAGKPDPQGYQLGIAALGGNAQSTVVFEDAPAGIEAGRRSGAIVVGVATTHAAHELPAHHIVADLRNVEVMSDVGLLRVRLT